MFKYNFANRVAFQFYLSHLYIFITILFHFCTYFPLFFLFALIFLVNLVIYTKFGWPRFHITSNFATCSILASCSVLHTRNLICSHRLEIVIIFQKFFLLSLEDIFNSSFIFVFFFFLHFFASHVFFSFFLCKLPQYSPRLVLSQSLFFHLPTTDLCYHVGGVKVSMNKTVLL